MLKLRQTHRECITKTKGLIVLLIFWNTTQNKIVPKAFKAFNLIDIVSYASHILMISVRTPKTVPTVMLASRRMVRDQCFIGCFNLLFPF
jgi:hypothetical protein